MIIIIIGEFRQHAFSGQKSTDTPEDGYYECEGEKKEAYHQGAVSAQGFCGQVADPQPKGAGSLKTKIGRCGGQQTGGGGSGYNHRAADQKRDQQQAGGTVGPPVPSPEYEDERYDKSAVTTYQKEAHRRDRSELPPGIQDLIRSQAGVRVVVGRVGHQTGQNEECHRHQEETKNPVSLLDRAIARHEIRLIGLNIDVDTPEARDQVAVENFI